MMPAAECFECLKRHMGKRRHCLIHGELPAYVKNEWQRTYLDCSATRSASVGRILTYISFLKFSAPSASQRRVFAVKSELL